MVMKRVGTKSHPLHRKESVARYVVRSRRVWRLYWRLNKLFVQLGFEYEHRGG